MAEMNMTDIMASIGNTLRRDPETGKVDLDGLVGLVSQGFMNPNISRALNHFAQITNSDADTKGRPRDFGKVMFNCLPVQSTSIWVLKLRFSGMVDAEGRPVSSRRAAKEEGLRQSFQLFSWIKAGPEMGEDVCRSMDTYIGPPTSQQVEDLIRTSMAFPCTGLEPCLPSALFISHTLKHHVPAIQPFLDSLPSPFLWKVAPMELEAITNQVRNSERTWRFNRNLGFAKERKEQGNKEFAAKDPKKAIECYTQAIVYLEKAVLRLKEDDQTLIDEAKALQAICFANCSCARLLLGKEEETQLAIENAKMSIALDELYPKGYIRLSRAYQAQEKHAEAEDAIVQGLSLPELENQQGLVDHLISLQTGGKGLPTDAEAFTNWLKETFSEGEPRATRMKGVGGLWVKMCNEHIDKMRSCSLASKA